MKYIQFILILFSLWSCKNEVNILDNTVIDNSIKSEKLLSFEKVLIDTTIFDKSKIIPLETNDKNLFQNIDRITIKNNRIYILDSSLEMICIFDDNGKYINQIHKVGQGPEEYVSIMDFCLDEKNNELLLLCDVPYKLMRFSIEGQFIDDISYTNFYGEISIYSDNIYCMQNEIKDKYEIGCFDRKMKPIYQGLNTREKINKECYNSGKALVRSSNNIIYTRRFDPCIYYLSKNSIEKKYELDFGKFAFPTDLQYESKCSTLFKMAKDNEYIFSITNAIESNKYIFFSTNLGICIYEKETNKLKGYKMLRNQLLSSGSNIYFPNEGNNGIISIIQPASLAYYREEIIAENAVVRNLVENVKLDDNPILIVYKFK